MVALTIVQHINAFKLIFGLKPVGWVNSGSHNFPIKYYWYLMMKAIIKYVPSQ